MNDGLKREKISCYMLKMNNIFFAGTGEASFAHEIMRRKGSSKIETPKRYMPVGFEPSIHEYKRELPRRRRDVLVRNPTSACEGSTTNLETGSIYCD